MREIDVKKVREQPLSERRMTALIYGPSGSGKTRFAASFPRPLFLSEKREGGWTTIVEMDDSEFYEPGVAPRVWEIETAQDMMMSVEALKKGLVEKPGSIKTVVVDSLTFYTNAYLSQLEAAAANNPKAQGFEVYRKLGQHTSHFMTAMHGLGINVVWLALAKEPGEGSTTGEVMLTGQAAKIAPASCDYVMYTRSYKTTPTAKTQWSLHPHGYGIWMGRCRDGGVLPDEIEDMSYRGFMKALKAGQEAKKVAQAEAAAAAIEAEKAEKAEKAKK